MASFQACHGEHAWGRFGLYQKSATQVSAKQNWRNPSSNLIQLSAIFLRLRFLAKFKFPDKVRIIITKAQFLWMGLGNVAIYKWNFLLAIIFSLPILASGIQTRWNCRRNMIQMCLKLLFILPAKFSRMQSTIDSGHSAIDTRIT